MEQHPTVLKALSNAHGVTGDEQEVLGVIKNELRAMDIAHEQLPFGDILCGVTDKPKVLLSAHVDEVGFMVHKIHSDGTLGVSNLGWIKPHMLNETSVYIKTQSGNRVRGQGYARVGMLEEHVPSFAQVTVDIGANTPAQVETLGVRVGDIGTFQKDFWTTADTFFGSALDNRLGVYGLLEFIRSNPALLTKVAVAFHTHEELDFEGLRGVVHRLQPQFVLSLDMFPVQQQFVPNDTPIVIGKGPAVLYQTGRYVMHYPLRQLFESFTGVPFQRAVLDTGPIEIEPLAIQGDGTTIATNIFYPVRGYHHCIYAVRVADIDAVHTFLGQLIPHLLQ